MKRKLISKILPVGMVIAMMASTLGAVPMTTYAATTQWDGSVAAEAPEQDAAGNYQIKDGADLAWFAAQTNVSGILTDDIDLNGQSWTSIASFANATLDGDGHTISGLTAPLINSLNENGVVKNLTVDCNISTTAQFTGAIACTSTSVNGGKIENCTVTGSITTSKSTAGGIIGKSNSQIINCVNKATITVTAKYISYFGGIVGELTLNDGQTTTVKVEGCRNEGAINTTAVGKYGNSIGGIVGIARTGTMISSSCNLAAIQAGDSPKAAGIVGEVTGTAAVTITDCYNTGSVTSTGINIGGILGSGSASAPTAITNSYNAGTITGGTSNVNSVFGANAACTNTFALEGTAAEAGTDVTVKTTEELKALAPTLGEAFKADDAEAPANSGYPVLVNCGTYALTDPAVEVVIAAIDEIGEVSFTDACKAKIDAAMEAYKALSTDQQAQVSNLAVLTKADIDYKANIEADVYVTAQADNAFMVAPQTLEVTADLAETYGYTDLVTNAVSTLDVLVAEHIAVFGKDDFAADPSAYLNVLASGWVTLAFGSDASFSFAVNEEAPNDGVLASWGSYNGYTINQAEVTDDDKVEFLTYQSSSWSDLYTSFKNGSIQDVKRGESVAVELTGYSYSGYATSPAETIAANTSAIANAQLAYVNPETGAITPIAGKVTDAKGKATLTFEKEGSYLVTAYIPAEDIKEGATPIFMPLMVVNVAENAALDNANVFKSATVTLAKTATYTGSAIKPAVTVKAGTKTLQNGTDYTVSYKNNTNVGTATVTIKGKGAYASAAAKTATFKINQKKITAASFSKVAAQTYSGKAKTPAVKVKNGKVILTKNKDYTISYSSNKKIGTAKIVITGKGNFTGSKTILFKINPKATKITKVTKGNKQLTLKWNKVSGVTGYKVYRSTSKKGTYKYVATVKGSSKTTYTNKKLKANKTYYYKVVSYKTVGKTTYKSSYSVVKSGKTSK